MKVIGGILTIIALIFSIIVTYHVVKVSAPDYMGFWITSVVLLVAGVVFNAVGELE